MRAGIAARSRALVSCLRRVSHTPNFVTSPKFSEFIQLSSPSLRVSSLSGAGPGFINKLGVDSVWSQRSLAPFAASQGVADIGHGWRFSVGRPARAQNHVFLLQGLATQTSVRTETPTRMPIESKPASETKLPPSSNASSLPPPTGMGKPDEKPRMKVSGIVKKTVLDFGAVPFPALALGIAGLIPFVALAPPLAQMLPLPGILEAGHANAQAAYGASIISFLGAIHWGLAMADYAAPGKGGVANATLMTFRYAWSVVPSLMAWTALLLPATTKFAVLIVSLWMVHGVDVLFARLKLVPYWFLSLRWPLTLVASASMIPSMLATATWTS